MKILIRPRLTILDSGDTQFGSSAAWRQDPECVKAYGALIGDEFSALLSSVRETAEGPVDLNDGY